MEISKVARRRDVAVRRDEVLRWVLPAYNPVLWDAVQVSVDRTVSLVPALLAQGRMA